MIFDSYCNVKYCIVIILPLLFCFNSIAKEFDEMDVQFNYFGQPIELNYTTAYDGNLATPINRQHLVKAISQLEKGPYTSRTLKKLKQYAADFQLNDWGFYILIRQFSQHLYPTANANTHILLSWYFLTELGYKTQLNYFDSHLFLLIYSEDRIYNLPSQALSNGWLVDVSNPFLINEDAQKNFTAKRFYFQADEKAHAFSFVLDNPPLFEKQNIVNRQLRFSHDDLAYLIEVRIDQNLMEFMYLYPDASVAEHSYISLANSAYNSLIPSLSRILRNKTPRASARLLLSFMRQAFSYKSDKQAYLVNNVTFSPEETLFYEYSDCEDRSVLFKYLLKELLDIDSVILKYNDHVLVGVDLGKYATGETIQHEGKSYILCDPTGPSDDLGVGEYPDFVKVQAYEVIK